MAIMSEEGKFRFNVSVNIAILIAFIGGAFGLWTTIVQKYDDVSTKILIMEQSIDKMDARSAAVDSLDKRVEAQGQHMVLDEQRTMTLESKVDALTSLLNEFMGTIRNSHAPSAPASTPTPNPTRD
jgi:Tfp pilus assembly protein PilN